MNMVPNELQDAVDLINNWKRDLNKNPELLKISFCTDCGEAFPSLPEDSAAHQPRCRECVPAHKRKQAALRQKAAREKAKQKQQSQTI